jgi:uncharacterized protein YndB with AHSA1/START domain
MSNENEFTVEPTILTREYNAPRRLVFDAWTQVEHLKNWMFLFKGFTCEYVFAEAFEASRSEHGKGWGGGLEQLDAYLGTL